MTSIKDKNLPASVKNHSKWAMQRRGFIKAMLVGTVATQIPWWVACSNNFEGKEAFIFSPKQKEILIIVQEFLFPPDGDGPGASEIYADKYLQWVVLDPEMDKEEIKYIFKGIGWVEETAEEEKQHEFLKLDTKNQIEILTYIADQDWGESWYSVLLTFIFEALLSDPIYGSNPNGIGWKWLNHNPGHPRPEEKQKYGQFLPYVNSKTHKP